MKVAWIVLRSTLNTGVTLLCFHLLGNTPVSRDLLNNLVNGPEISPAISLNLAEIPSGPTDFFISRCANKEYTADSGIEQNPNSLRSTQKEQK